MLNDPMFWYAVAFTIFIVLAWHYGHKPMAGWLDSGISKIRDDLDRARALRAEAEATLADYKKRYDAAVAEAEIIVRHAREEATRLKMQAETDLKNALARHEQQALERLRLAEADALAAVRAAAVDQAMVLARAALTEQLKGTAATALTDRAIAEISQSAAAKAKAA